MPCRMVDGDALWTSSKLRRIPEEYRWHYPLWLPLPEANGTFEVDVDAIWARVYATLFPSVTREDVSLVIDEFVKADLLSVWNVDNHLYGFLVGMEKGSRLPSPSQQKKYTKKYPDWPNLLETSKTPPRDLMEISYQGKVREGKVREGKEEENDMALADKLRNIVYEKTGKATKVPDYIISEFRRRVGTEKEKLQAFREYVDNHPDSDHPLYSFLETEPDEVVVKAAAVNGLVVNEKAKLIASKVFSICDLAVAGKDLAAAENLAQRYSVDQIMEAFRYFYSKLDDKSSKYAVLKFFGQGGGDSIIGSIAEQKAQQAELARRVEAAPAMPIEASDDEEEEDGVEIDF